MRRPCTLPELDDYERLAHETGLRHEALIVEWNKRLLTRVLQSPPPFKPTISAAAFISRMAHDVRLMKRAREQAHEDHSA